MQMVSLGDNLSEMSLCFMDKVLKVNLLSAEFAQRVLEISQNVNTLFILIDITFHKCILILNYKNQFFYSDN